MAQIRTLMQNDTQVLPRTVAEAVSTDAGSNVQAELDALRGDIENVDVSDQLQNYLPLSGGMMSGSINFDDNENVSILKNSRSDQTGISLQSFASDNNNGIYVESYVNLANEENPEPVFEILLYKDKDNGNPTTYMSLKEGILQFGAGISGNPIILDGIKTPQEDNQAVNKKYVDDQIATIPTPDVRGQIETHNTSETAHANMHWLTADDEMLSSIDPDGSIDADTLEGHPASDFVLKSELSTLVPAPDLTNYYTKAQVDEKITQIQNLIDQAAALVDEINGEVI